MTVSRRAPNPRLVKIHRNCSVEEAAKRLDVHKNTIREWIRRGLPVMKERRPVLIHGKALREFLVQSRGRNMRPCAPGHIY
ncbi:MAG: helix-turn-helix domain-containing protein, partial [Rudaea sp.]